MTNQFGRAIARTSRREREGIRGHRGGRKRVRSRPVVRSEAALAIYICRQHNKPHYRFWDLGLKGQALRQIRAPSELAPWVQARGWREIAFFRFFSLPAPAATDPPANFIHTLTNHSQAQVQMLGTLCLSTKEPITTKHRFSGSICAGFGVPLLQHLFSERKSMVC